MAFDPDAYLAALKQGGFDPDQYLSGTKGTGASFDPDAYLNSSKADTPAPAIVPRSTPPSSSIFRRAVVDPAISLARGLISVPETVVGLANIPTLGRAGKLVESAGLDLGGAKEFWGDLSSPESKAAQAEVETAPGIVGKVGAALRNPSTIVSGAIESAPGMLVGGGIGKGLSALPKLAKLGQAGKIIAGAGGETIVTAGQNIEGMRQETPTGTLSAGQVGIGTASAALTGVLGVFGGKAAKWMKVSDPDTILAGGEAGQRNLFMRIIGGMVSEGAFEELPQSIQEQIASNLALGKPWQEGVEQSAAMGAVIGGVMGAAAQAARRPVLQRPPPAPAAPAGQPPPPPQISAVPAAGIPFTGTRPPITAGGGESLASSEPVMPTIQDQIAMRTGGMDPANRLAVPTRQDQWQAYTEEQARIQREQQAQDQVDRVQDVQDRLEQAQMPQEPPPPPMQPPAPALSRPPQPAGEPAAPPKPLAPVAGVQPLPKAGADSFPASPTGAGASTVKPVVEPSWRDAGTLRKNADGMWEMDDDSINPQPTAKEAAASIVEVEPTSHVAIRRIKGTDTFKVQVADWDAKEPDAANHRILDFRDVELSTPSPKKVLPSPTAAPKKPAAPGSPGGTASSAVVTGPDAQGRYTITIGRNAYSQQLPDGWTVEDLVKSVEATHAEREAQAPEKRKKGMPAIRDSHVIPLIQWINDNGGIKPKGAIIKKYGKAGGEYDGQPTNPELGPFARMVFNSRSGEPVDRVAQAAFDRGLIPEPDSDVLWEAIRAERKGHARLKADEKAMDKEAVQYRQWVKSGSEVMPRKRIEKLGVGDSFKIQGEKFTILEETDTGLVVKDGREFGVPYEQLEDYELRIDKGSFRKSTKEPKASLDQRIEDEDAKAAAEREANAKPPAPALTLEAQTPEQVEAERVAKEKAAAKAKMDAEANKPLVGKELDTTGSLLEGVEADNPLFAAPTPKPKISAAAPKAATTSPAGREAVSDLKNAGDTSPEQAVARRGFAGVKLPKGANALRLTFPDKGATPAVLMKGDDATFDQPYAKVEAVYVPNDANGRPARDRLKVMPGEIKVADQPKYRTEGEQDYSDENTIGTQAKDSQVTQGVGRDSKESITGGNGNSDMGTIGRDEGALPLNDGKRVRQVEPGSARQGSSGKGGNPLESKTGSGERKPGNDARVSEILRSSTGSDPRVIAIIHRILGTAADVTIVDRLFERGADRLGKYQAGLVTIAQRGDMERTAFHEAYHGAEDMLFTDKEREITERIEPDAEKRADAFMEYAAGNKGFTGRLRGMFDRLMFRIKSLFGAAGKVDELRALHARIMGGGMAGRDQSGVTGAEPAYRTAPDSDRADREEMVRESLAAAQSRVKRIAAKMRGKVIDQKITGDDPTGNQVSYADLTDQMSEAVASMHAKAIAEGGSEVVEQVRDVYREIARSLPKSVRGEMMSALSKVKNEETADAAMGKLQDVVVEWKKATYRAAIGKQYVKIMARKKMHIDQRDLAREAFNGVNLKDLSVQELAALHEQMRSLAFTGEMRFKVQEALDIDRNKQAIRNLNAQEGNIAFNKMELATPGKGGIQDLTFNDKAMNLLKRWGNAVRGVYWSGSGNGRLFDQLDGFKNYMGKHYETFKAPLDTKENQFEMEVRPIIKGIMEIVKRNDLTTEHVRKIGLFAAYNQEGGKEKLKNLGFDDPRQIEAIADEVKASPGMMEFYNYARREFDRIRPRIHKVLRRTYNVDMKDVDNYFSFMTDWAITDDADTAMFVQKVDADGLPTSYMLDTTANLKKNTEKNFAKARSGAGNQKINLDALFVFTKRLQDMYWFTHMSAEVKRLGELANSQEYGRIAGKDGQKLVRQYVDLMARRGGTTGVHNIRQLDTLINNLGVGTLGFRASTILIQPTSLMNAMGVIGRHAVTGFVEMMNPESRRFVMENMPEITSGAGKDIFIREAKESIGFKQLKEKGMAPMVFMDRMTRGGVALGAYRRFLEKKGVAVDFSKPDQEAIQYAQRIAAETQATGHFKDAPLLMTRGLLMNSKTLTRAIMQFQSYPMNNFYFMVNDGLRTAIAQKDYRKLAGIMAATQAAFLAEGLVRIGLKQVLPGGSGDDDKKDLSELLAQNHVKNFVGQIPLVGSIASSARYGSFPAPVVETARRFQAGMTSATTAKQPEARQRGAVKAAGAVGALSGIPGISQASQIWGGLIKSDSEEVRAEIQKSVRAIDADEVDYYANIMYVRLSRAGKLKRGTSLPEFRARYRQAFKTQNAEEA